MKPMDLSALLKQVAQERPIFHAEKDFQHALAWTIQRDYANANIRLEKRSTKIAQRMYVDIWVELDGKLHLFELKYKTKALVIEHNGEPFDLLNQGAQDIGRYDFFKDLQRLELLTSAYPDAIGYAILLTNDESYRQQSLSPSTIDMDFRLQEGRRISGKLRWQTNAGAGTTRGREEPIVLTKGYDVKWQPYSSLGKTSREQFAYLALRTQET